MNKIIGIYDSKIHNDNICEKDFNNEMSLRKKIKSSCRDDRHCHQIAFDGRNSFIKENVIEGVVISDISTWILHGIIRGDAGYSDIRKVGRKASGNSEGRF